MHVSLGNARAAYFYIAAAILAVAALGSIIIGSLSVRKSRQSGESVHDTAVALTAIGATALFASLLLVAFYVTATWHDGNWLHTLVDKVRGVPHDFARKKRALQQRFADRAIEKMMRTAQLRVEVDKTLGKSRASEKQKMLAALQDAYKAAPNKTPDAIAAELDAQPGITAAEAAQAKQVLSAVNRSAQQSAAEQVDAAEQQAFAIVGGKKVDLPPPPPPVAPLQAGSSYESLPADWSR